MLQTVLRSSRRARLILQLANGTRRNIRLIACESSKVKFSIFNRNDMKGKFNNNYCFMGKRSFSSLPSHTVLTMPALSPTMEQGTIASWEKKEGDEVNAGDVLAQVETDKATVSFDSTEDGFLAKILVPAGSSNIPVGTPVAIFVDDESSISAFKNYSGDESASKVEPSDNSKGNETANDTKETNETSHVKENPKTSTSEHSNGRIKASPAAKALAHEKGIDISQVNGTGPDHRIIKADILEFKPVKSTAVSSTESASKRTTTAQPVSTPSSNEDFEDVPTSNMRRVIAQRLSESKQNIPHYYVAVEVNMDSILKLRSELNKKLSESEGIKLSVNDFIIKAAAAALRKVPQVNCSWQGSSIRNYNYVDISVAVSTETGLITPIIADADIKGLSAISNEMKSLAKKARENKLAPHEFQGGTFTISNLGMYGVKHFSAIINPPQAGILAIGGTESKVVLAGNNEDGSPKFKTVSVMTVNASFDHRVVDGAVGAQWLNAFKSFCENPSTMLL